MVHALREVWRVLAAGGALLDLRPRPAQNPIEAVTASEVFRLGELDAYGSKGDSTAADSAARHTVEAGSLVLTQETYFEVAFCFDTVAELASSAAEDRSVTRVTPSYAELEKLVIDLATRHGEVRLRYRKPMMLAAYRKATPIARS